MKRESLCGTSELEHSQYGVSESEMSERVTVW